MPSEARHSLDHDAVPAQELGSVGERNHPAPRLDPRRSRSELEILELTVALRETEQQIERLRGTISYQLGSTLLQAGRSWRDLARLPLALFLLWREAQRRSAARSGGRTHPLPLALGRLLNEARIRLQMASTESVIAFLGRQKLAPANRALLLSELATSLAETAPQDAMLLAHAAIRVHPSSAKPLTVACRLQDVGAEAEALELLKEMALQGGLDTAVAELRAFQAVVLPAAATASSTWRSARRATSTPRRKAALLLFEDERLHSTALNGAAVPSTFRLLATALRQLDWAAQALPLDPRSARASQTGDGSSALRRQPSLEQQWQNCVEGVVKAAQPGVGEPLHVEFGPAAAVAALTVAARTARPLVLDLSWLPEAERQSAQIPADHPLDLSRRLGREALAASRLVISRSERLAERCARLVPGIDVISAPPCLPELGKLSLPPDLRRDHRGAIRLLVIDAAETPLVVDKAFRLLLPLLREIPDLEIAFHGRRPVGLALLRALRSAGLTTLMSVASLPSFFAPYAIPSGVHAALLPPGLSGNEALAFRRATLALADGLPLLLLEESQRESPLVRWADSLVVVLQHQKREAVGLLRALADDAEPMMQRMSLARQRLEKDCSLDAEANRLAAAYQSLASGSASLSAAASA